MNELGHLKFELEINKEDYYSFFEDILLLYIQFKLKILNKSI